MRVFSKKATGVAMILLSAIGFLLSIFFCVQTWRYRLPVTNQLQSGLETTSAILQTTDDGLGVIDEVVKNVYTSTQMLNDATNALGKAMLSTGQFMDSAGTFVGQDLVNTITNTQEALNSAQASAAVIDDVLTSLSSLPLIGFSYQPSIPLNTALGNVSSSLNPVQQSLKQFQANLETTQSDMQLVSEQIMSLETQILTINQNLAQAETTIADYRSQVNSLISSIDKAKSSLPGWITTVVGIITLIIAWLVLIQIGTLLQGISFITTERSTSRNQDTQS
jgi:polyhydroxyalkanoate synthesis regulator phasin